MKKRFAVIGTGISGLAAAHFLRENAEVVIYEKSSRAGGLIQCDSVDDILYHKVGGHIFNSKIDDVLNWFWRFFDREREFYKAKRNAGIALSKNNIVGYPIENYLYQLPEETSKAVLKELLAIHQNPHATPRNFDEFLRSKFGETLFELYFKPYNQKIWRKDLKNVSLSWLEGKLPMPEIDEILYSNIHRKEESNMVHSCFYYPRLGGSQFIADRLAEGLNIRFKTSIECISIGNSRLRLNGEEEYDAVLFTGNIKELMRLLSGVTICERLRCAIDDLAFHGTTTVLCEIDHNPYSWVYLPESGYRSHRIICTGNFSPFNNRRGKLSGTVEFSDKVELQEIKDSLKNLPFNPTYITHKFTKYTYPIQFSETRSVIKEAETLLRKSGIYFSGRFADWEYYNMDTAIHAAKTKVINMISEITRT